MKTAIFLPMSDSGIIDPGYKVVDANNAGPSVTSGPIWLGSAELNPLFDQEMGCRMEEILSEVTLTQDFPHARMKVLEMVEEHNICNQREDLFEWVDQFELQNKEMTKDKGKAKELGSQSKRGGVMGEEDDVRCMRKRNKKACGDGSSDSSDGDDLLESKLAGFVWSGKDENSTIAGGYRNLKLAKKMNQLQQYYIKNKKSALQDLKGQITCPEFPPSLWEAVLLNQYVNFNKIHAI